MSFQSASKMLKVTGILCIIGGAFTLFYSLLALLGGGMLSVVSGAAGAIIIIAAIISMVGGAFELVTGILGVKNCQIPEKANICFILGIISVVIGIVSICTSGISVSSIISLALPILYTVAAFFVKKAQVM